MWEDLRRKHLERLEEAKKKGEVDIPIIPLLNLINNVPDLFTTSSCSGRIILLSTTEKEDKAGSFFHRKWHRPVTIEEVLEGIESFSGEFLWFKMDPFILHVSSRTLDLAKKLVSTARVAGIKIAGIQVIDKDRVHVEIRGIDSISTPVVWRSRKVADKDYVRVLVEAGNRKMVRNNQRMEKLYGEWYKLFKSLYPDLFG